MGTSGSVPGPFFCSWHLLVLAVPEPIAERLSWRVFAISIKFVNAGLGGVGDVALAGIRLVQTKQGALTHSNHSDLSVVCLDLRLCFGGSRLEVGWKSVSARAPRPFSRSATGFDPAGTKSCDEEERRRSVWAGQFPISGPIDLGRGRSLAGERAGGRAGNPPNFQPTSNRLPRTSGFYRLQ